MNFLSGLRQKLAETDKAVPITKEAILAPLVAAGVIGTVEAAALAKKLIDKKNTPSYNFTDDEIVLPSKFWMSLASPGLALRPKQLELFRKAIETHELAEKNEKESIKDYPEVIQSRLFRDIGKVPQITADHVNLSVLAQESNALKGHLGEYAARRLRKMRRHTGENELLEHLTGKRLYLDEFTPEDINILRNINEIIDYNDTHFYPRNEIAKILAEESPNE